MNDSSIRLSRRLPLSLAIAALLAGASAVTVAQDATTDTAERATGSAASAQLSWSDLDTDKNGSLSATEAEASPALNAHFGKADANADGALTSDEYRAYLAKRGTGMKDEAGDVPKN